MPGGKLQKPLLLLARHFRSPPHEFAPNARLNTEAGKYFHPVRVAIQ